MAQKSMLEGTQLGVQSGYLFRWSISNHVTNKLFGVETAVQQVTEHWVHNDELLPVVHEPVGLHINYNRRRQLKAGGYASQPPPKQSSVSY